jgi:hypothetical protein
MRYAKVLSIVVLVIILAGLIGATVYSYNVDWTGPQGAMGRQGLKGDSGLQGAQGIQGIQGLTGAMGAQGLQGELGEQGIQGLQGVKGDTGAQGEKGEQGDQGLQGDKGDKGDTGDVGAQGAQGSQGEQGEQGIQGQTGPQGIAGPNMIVAMGTINDKGILTTKYKVDGCVWNNATKSYTIDPHDFWYDFDKYVTLVTLVDSDGGKIATAGDDGWGNLVIRIAPYYYDYAHMPSGWSPINYRAACSFVVLAVK